MENKKFSVIGWVLILLFLYMISKTRTGYNIIYGVLVLILLFLLFTQSNAINRIIYKE